MTYSDPRLDGQGLKASNIFTEGWRILAFVKATKLFMWVWPFSWPFAILFNLLWRFRRVQTLIAMNKISPTVSWLLHLYGTGLEVFETDYLHAWTEELKRTANGSDEVVIINIFVGKESMSVPVLFNKGDKTKNSDAETFKQLLMWYSWIQYKGGFGELILPRRLVRVDKVRVGVFVFETGLSSRSLNSKTCADLHDVKEQSGAWRFHQDLRLGSRYVV